MSGMMETVECGSVAFEKGGGCCCRVMFSFVYVLERGGGLMGTWVYYTRKCSGDGLLWAW